MRSPFTALCPTFAAVLALLAQPVRAQGPVDCLATWDANPEKEKVTHYVVDIDGLSMSTTETSVKCSDFEPPIDPTVGQHLISVQAVNKWGTSEAATRPFGRPSKPANVAVLP